MKIRKASAAGSSRQKNARRLWGIGQTALGGEIDDGVNHRTHYLAVVVPTQASQFNQALNDLLRDL